MVFVLWPELLPVDIQAADANPLDKVNAMLSFVYTLLAHDTASALEAVGLDAYVSTLPAGLDTPMTSMKTGTAALLVTIARALAGSARLCIVDCALDRLEDRDRQVVWRALSERPWTLLLTTTRPELLDLSEHAFAIDRGRVARAGRGPVRLWQAEEA